MTHVGYISSASWSVGPRSSWQPSNLMRGANHFDRLVLRVAQARDRAAFQALFEYFAPRLKAYVLRLGAPPHAAEDLAQEAMLTLWRKAALFNPARASASTWIFTIVRNLRVDVLRRERLPRLDVDDLSLAPESEPSAGDGVEARQDNEALRHALQTLPLEQSEIVMLSFFSDKSHSQIAADLSIPLGTVKSRLRLAMTRLRAILGDTL